MQFIIVNSIALFRVLLYDTFRFIDGIKGVWKLTQLDILRENLGQCDETILERVRDDHSRPLLENNKNVSFIRELMEKRREKYEAAADIIIRTDGRSIQEIGEEIIVQLRVMDGLRD